MPPRQLPPQLSPLPLDLGYPVPARQPAAHLQTHLPYCLGGAGLLMLQLLLHAPVQQRRQQAPALHLTLPCCPAVREAAAYWGLTRHVPAADGPHRLAAAAAGLPAGCRTDPAGRVGGLQLLLQVPWPQFPGEMAAVLHACCHLPPAALWWRAGLVLQPVSQALQGPASRQGRPLKSQQTQGKHEPTAGQYVTLTLQRWHSSTS